MFASIDDVIQQFAAQRYICNRRIATVVYLATHLEKPILIEGPAGVGKTELAKVVAAALGLNLIRLQCYEGLDEAKALYEWEYAKQLLYTQILKDKISEVIGGATSLSDAVDRIAVQDDVFFSDRFILPRPLLRSITSAERTVLLIDEIDKSDSEFEAFLLEVLSDFTVSVPELGTLRATHIPIVLLTSNNAREMSDALKRRCLHLYIDFPSTIENKGGILMPVEMEVTYEDGSTERIKLPVDIWRNNELKFEKGFFSNKNIKKVVIDPDESYSDVDNKNNTWEAGKVEQPKPQETPSGTANPPKN